MPTEPPSRDRDGHVTEAAEDELTFAVHDLGRERAAPPATRDQAVFAARPTTAPVAPAPRQPVEAPRPAVAAARIPDGFVIRDLEGAVPVAPVDALVVGAPEPAAEPAPADAEEGEPRSFQISSTSTARVAPPEELWTTRNPTPESVPVPGTTVVSRRGWSTRHSGVVDRSAHATMLRLREEAVNICWKSAWLAVTSCDPRLLRKRASDRR